MPYFRIKMDTRYNMQDIIWEMLKQHMPYDFIELLCKIHHTDLKRDQSLSNYFGYFGSPESEVICPNIILSAEEDDIYNSGKPFSFTGRYGLCKCPINIIPEYMKDIMEHNRLKKK